MTVKNKVKVKDLMTVKIYGDSHDFEILSNVENQYFDGDEIIHFILVPLETSITKAKKIIKDIGSSYINKGYIKIVTEKGILIEHYNCDDEYVNTIFHDNIDPETGLKVLFIKNE